MTEERPAPLTPADCNLRGLPWMPLETVRLLDSDLFLLSTGDEFKAAVTLWCKSWNQLPGGSLPSDERLLEALSGSKTWKKVREMALRGWVECSDGRLYHPVVAEQAIRAWGGRQDHSDVVSAKSERQQRWRTHLKELAARLRDAGVTPPVGATKAELERLISIHVDGNVDVQASTGTSTNAPTVDATETASKGQGQLSNTPLPPKGVTEPPGFVRFWEEWPRSTRKQSRGKCLAAWKRENAEAIVADIVSHVAFMKNTTDWRKENGGYIPAPLVYLNGRRWEGAELAAAPERKRELVL